jgi:signal transduction histidine kinase
MSDDLALKQALLKQAFPELSEDILATMAGIAKLKSYPKEAVLCYEDRHEETFYVIHSGEVAFSKRMGEEDRLLRTGEAGEFFGEMTLLDDQIGRSATVRTTQETTVLELDRGALIQIIPKSPQLVMALAKIVIQRMRQNDRQAITELQAQKQEIENAYSDLKKLDEQRHIFLTTLAHELRTPLTSIMGYMQLVRGGHMTGPALQMSLEKIGSGLDRMVSLINDLFFLQEMDILAPRYKKMDLGGILEEVSEKCRERAEKQKVTLRLELGEAIPEIHGDPDGLQRAFWHLADNAIKFSPKGGDVILKLSAKDEVLSVVVQDHGIGIDPAFMPRIFERFVRDEKYEEHLFDGTGLGMPIVKQIVEMHRGTIEIESLRGQGTSVTVKLPADARRATVELKVDEAWVDAHE